jgi:hypothetical protein
MIVIRVLATDLMQCVGFRALFAAVRDHVEGHPCSLDQRCTAGLFDSRDMNKHVLSAIGRLDETVAFCRVKPLHFTVPLGTALAVLDRNGSAIIWRVVRANSKPPFGEAALGSVADVRTQSERTSRMIAAGHEHDSPASVQR